MEGGGTSTFVCMMLSTSTSLSASAAMAELSRSRPFIIVIGLSGVNSVATACLSTASADTGSSSKPQEMPTQTGRPACCAPASVASMRSWSTIISRTMKSAPAAAITFACPAIPSRMSSSEG